MKISVFGSGYVGLVTSACFADSGHKVCCFDIDLEKINNLRRGDIDIYEPGLKKMVLRNQKNKRLEFSYSSNKAIKFGDFIFICVGTPEKKDGSADLKFIRSVVDSICTEVSENKFVVIKSTVPPGTGNEIQETF